MSTRNIGKEMVKILRELHRGGDVEEIKRRFGNILSQVSPSEILLIEQQLVKEGVVEEILKLCDLHVELSENTFNQESSKGFLKAIL